MSKSEEEEILLILLANSLLAARQRQRVRDAPKKRRRQRRWWVRPALQQREELGHACKLLPLLRSRDVEYYRDYLRMPPQAFDTLLELVGPRIRKKDTKFRKAIPPDHRLAQTLRFLAAGDTVRSSSFCFLNGRSTACGIISTTCRAIWEVLGPIYVACPTEPEEWLQIASDFEERWNLPHCLGAIDGKHVAVECPANSGSVNRNYKHFFSKSLLAISDAYYRFLYVEVGHFGSESDGGVFNRSTLQKSIEQGQSGFPPGKQLGAVGNMPYFIVGDEAFPLKTYVMRPYSKKSLKPLFPSSSETITATSDSSALKDFEETHQRRIFNYRLSRARRVVENAFGIMAQRWRILRRPFKAKEENTRYIISACLTLHNFLLKESRASRSTYCPPGTADHPEWEGRIVDGSWRAEDDTNIALSDLPNTGGNSTRLAYEMRDRLCRHLITDGKVPWQVDMIRRNRF